ncbi:hypothetical protein [Nocardia cyriacigeorgica]|uniref:hypothetical protein n=1 Tax=Nocardia cyriacigeorgica TaxID=135487 RepID=UPI00189638B1|nr:hypothetical protein [Nocardia cyriacigeorgica]MBF6287669.1 hypothetical protein [Nocardia cyriacigeorgica]MBF6425357.1 hypothetical protein [Nocardia cyriacigeorgica]BDT89775.1 hypothetical protein FMUAM8_55390 [Nocardia cyriacigeorgica]BDU09162.1 hypothetical protein FMUBM48_54250 [Nocardia cyriacigeorgica]
MEIEAEFAVARLRYCRDYQAISFRFRGIRGRHPRRVAWLLLPVRVCLPARNLLGCRGRVVIDRCFGIRAGQFGMWLSAGNVLSHRAFLEFEIKKSSVRRGRLNG